MNSPVIAPGNESAGWSVNSLLRLPTSVAHVCEHLEVKALTTYRIWIRYADGFEGEVDLSHLAGRGVFELGG